MKALCLVLVLGLSMPGCSMFSKSARMDRAYYRQLKHVKKDRDKRRKKTIQKRSEMPSLREPPPLQQNVQPSQPPPENQ